MRGKLRSSFVETNMFGGRGGTRTRGPLLAKRPSRFQQPPRLLAFTTNRGICFRSKANPNRLKTTCSCTVRAVHHWGEPRREAGLVMRSALTFFATWRELPRIGALPLTLANRDDSLRSRWWLLRLCVFVMCIYSIQSAQLFEVR